MTCFNYIVLSLFILSLFIVHCFGIIATMFDKIYFGPFSVSTYTFLLDIGILGTLAWLWWRAKNYGRESSRWLDAGISAVAGAIIGGRFAFGFANWAYFQNHLLEMFRFWERRLRMVWCRAGRGDRSGSILFFKGRVFRDNSGRTCATKFVFVRSSLDRLRRQRLRRRTRRSAGYPALRHEPA